MNIRWMIRRDMPEVVAMDSLSHAACWREEDFLRGLRQRDCIGMVVEKGDGRGDDAEPLLDFFVYELHRTKLHVARLAVHPAWRRRGVGRNIFFKLDSKLSGRGRNRFTIDVPEDALAAQLFLKAMGCTAIKILRGQDEPDLYRFVYRVACPTEFTRGET